MFNFVKKVYEIRTSQTASEYKPNDSTNSPLILNFLTKVNNKKNYEAHNSYDAEKYREILIKRFKHNFSTALRNQSKSQR